MVVALLANSCSSSLGSVQQWTWKNRSQFPLNFNGNSSSSNRAVVVKAFNCDPNQVPILKQAFKEPVAFVGGMFAGILRLDLNEDPLKEWVTRTVEASAISGEEISEEGLKAEDDSPQEIEIE